MNVKYWGRIAIGIALLSATPAAAAIVDTGVCTVGCVGVPLNTNIFGHVISAAGIRFATTQTFHLTSIASTFSGSGAGTFSIYSLTAGNLPDQPIFSEAFNVPMGGSGFGATSVGLDVYLAPGSWALVTQPGAGVATLMAQAGSPSLSYTVYPSFARVDGVWQGLPMSYMGKSIAFSLNGDAAPEPTTWAMMIGGLGLVGAAMRRTKGTKGLKQA